MNTRTTITQQLTNLVDDLTVRLLITAHYQWRPTRHSEGGTAPDTGPLPKPEPRSLHRTDPPITFQLAHTRTLQTTGSHEPVSGGKPGSRPPANLTQADLLHQLAADAQTWRNQLALQAGHDQPKPAPVDANLSALRGLALNPHTSITLITAITHNLRRYRNEALIVLDYEAPIVTMNFVCPDCAGKLVTRSDASTDVWCAGGIPVEGPACEGEHWPVRTKGCGDTWPRHCWPDLLAGIA